MQKSLGPTLTDWDTNAWQKYNSQSFPWCYAIAHDGENAYVEASEQEKNVAEDAPHDTGFTASVPANNYTYYATGGCGFDVVMRKVKDESGIERPLFNFRKRGRIIFYMDFTNYLQFRRGKAYGWGTNGIKYELFSNGRIRKSLNESKFKQLYQIVNEEIRKVITERKQSSATHSKKNTLSDLQISDKLIKLVSKLHVKGKLSQQDADKILFYGLYNNRYFEHGGRKTLSEG